MLRRRLPPNNTTIPTVSQDTSEATTPEPNDDTKPHNGKQIILKPRSKRRNGLIFVLGGLFGIFIALFFANQQEVISLDSLMDLNLDTLIDVIPQGIVKDAREFSVRSLFCRYYSELMLVVVLMVDDDSNTNATPLATTPSPSAYTSNRKASKPNTPSS